MELLIIESASFGLLPPAHVAFAIAIRAVLCGRLRYLQRWNEEGKHKGIYGERGCDDGKARVEEGLDEKGKLTIGL